MNDGVRQAIQQHFSPPDFDSEGLKTAFGRVRKLGWEPSDKVERWIRRACATKATGDMAVLLWRQSGRRRSVTEQQMGLEGWTWG